MCIKTLAIRLTSLSLWTITLGGKERLKVVGKLLLPRVVPPPRPIYTLFGVVCYSYGGREKKRQPYLVDIALPSPPPFP